MTQQATLKYSIIIKADDNTINQIKSKINSEIIHQLLEKAGIHGDLDVEVLAEAPHLVGSQSGGLSSKEWMEDHSPHGQSSLGSRVGHKDPKPSKPGQGGGLSSGEWD